MRQVLVIAAHPDDEVIGLGGTLVAEHAHDRVTVAFLADGETSGNPSAAEEGPRGQARREMAHRAAALLGIDELVFLGFPDQRLDAVPLLDLIRAVQPHADRLKPHIVYAHTQHDLNLDHRIAGQVALTLFRPAAQSSVESIYAFEGEGSPWTFGQLGGAFSPQRFVDISAGFEKKCAALKAYESELKSPPHPRSLPMLEATAKKWGAVAGLSVAEGFEVVRTVRRDGARP